MLLEVAVTPLNLLWALPRTNARKNGFQSRGAFLRLVHSLALSLCLSYCRCSGIADPCNHPHEECRTMYKYNCPSHCTLVKPKAQTLPPPKLRTARCAKEALKPLYDPAAMAASVRAPVRACLGLSPSTFIHDECAVLIEDTIIRKP